MREKRVRNSGNEAKRRADYRKAKGIYNDLMSEIRLTGVLSKGDFTKLKRAVSKIGKDWLTVQSEINRYQGEWLRENPSQTALELLKFKINERPYGLPADQLTATEKALIKKHARTFENDGGYIKLRVTVTKKRNTVNGTTLYVFSIYVHEEHSWGFDGKIEIQATSLVEAKRKVLRQLDGYKIVDTEKEGDGYGLYIELKNRNSKRNGNLTDAKIRQMVKKDVALADVIRRMGHKEIRFDTANHYDREIIFEYPQLFSDRFLDDETKDHDKAVIFTSVSDRTKKALKGGTVRNSRSGTRTVGNAKRVTLGEFNDLVNKVRKGNGILWNPSAKDIKTAKARAGAFRIDNYGDTFIAFTDAFSKKQKRTGSFQARNSKTNASFNEDKLDSFSAMFQGNINGDEIKTVGSDHTPSLVSRMGRLTLLKFKNGKDVYEIPFKGDAWASVDVRKNIYIDGKDARITNIDLPAKGELMALGKATQINYVTNKSHIENGDTVEYYHEFGEVDGIQPNAFLDHDGYPILVGGNYDIGVHGIEN